MVPPVDVAAMPTVMSLVELAAEIRSEADVEALRPSIGGKSAGFLALIAADGVSTPDDPLAITVAPYVRHLANIEAELEAMLADDDFRTDARARFLLLEGPGAYAETYTNDRRRRLRFVVRRPTPDGPDPDHSRGGRVHRPLPFRRHERRRPRHDHRPTPIDVRRAGGDAGPALPIVELGRGHRRFHRRRPVRLEHRVPRPGAAAGRRRPQQDRRTNDQEDMGLLLELRGLRGAATRERRSPQWWHGQCWSTRGSTTTLEKQQRRRHPHAAAGRTR